MGFSYLMIAHVGVVLHPNGNLAEYLVASGYARIVDWHAGMLLDGRMERLRAAEKTAKEQKLRLFATTTTTTPVSKSNGATQTNGTSKSFDGTVIRVWSGDQISVIEKDSTVERRIQFSSTRAPKYNIDT